MRSSVATVQLNVSGVYINTLDDGNKSRAIWRSGQVEIQLANGYDESEADRIWYSKERLLANNASENIDLYDFGSIDIGAGAGRDPLGQSLALAELVLLYVHNRWDSAGNLVLGNYGVAGEWTSYISSGGTITLRPNSHLLLVTKKDPGWLIADGSNHILKIAASGGQVGYDMYVGGRSE